MADETGGGPLSPAVAKERGQTLRLTGQLIDLVAPGQLLPTPLTTDNRSASEGDLRRNAPGLRAIGSFLPTPSANLGGNGGSQHPDKRRAGGHQPSIQDVAEHVLLPTPRATRGGSSTETMYLLGAEVDHSDRTQGEVLLPTPVAQPSGNSPEEHLRKKPGRERVTDLAILVENDMLTTGGKLLQTPSVADSEGSHERRGGARSDELLLPGQAKEMRTGWGPYEPAIRRWENVMCTPAPPPTVPNSRGKHRLNPAFTEWMMGQPDGWITEVDISVNDQIKACGNGVVTQQALEALHRMAARREQEGVSSGSP